jgi:hypothetical protein
VRVLDGAVAGRGGVAEVVQVEEVGGVSLLMGAGFYATDRRTREQSS